MNENNTAFYLLKQKNIIKNVLCVHMGLWIEAQWPCHVHADNITASECR